MCSPTEAQYRAVFPRCDVPSNVPSLADLLTVPFFACAFFAVLFFQSGFDKITDRQGNLNWMVPHFEKSPFRGRVPFLLSFLTLIEIGTAVACVAGLIDIAFRLGLSLPTYALALAGLTLLALFTGQRSAKDYVGAANLAVYFGVALLGLAFAPIL